MIPALPAVASSPRPSFSSSTVTSWPARARKYAVVTPTTPPPRTSVFMAPASRVEQEAVPERIGGGEQGLAEAREIGRAGNLGQNGRAPLDQGLARDAPGEVEPEQPPADERRADRHETAVMEERHARARARAARRRVDLARAPHERIGRHAVGVGQLVDQDVIHAGLPEPGDLDMELGVDRLADRHSALRELARVLAPDGDTGPGGVDDGEDVADANRDVERQLADTVDLDGLVGERHERRRPPQRDRADPVAVSANDGLDRAGLGVYHHPCLRALVGDHPGLERHRGRADGALAARDVVAAGVDEEEPEVRPGRDRLGHHRDQQTAVAARLQTEAGPEMVEMLLEPVAFVAQRGAGEPAEPARDQAHADAGGMRLRRADGVKPPAAALRQLTCAGCMRSWTALPATEATDHSPVTREKTCSR